MHVWRQHFTLKLIIKITLYQKIMGTGAVRRGPALLRGVEATGAPQPWRRGLNTSPHPSPPFTSTFYASYQLELTPPWPPTAIDIWPLAVFSRASRPHSFSFLHGLHLSVSWPPGLLLSVSWPPDHLLSVSWHPDHLLSVSWHPDHLL